jgi:S1-C subfamily serine protease
MSRGTNRRALVAAALVGFVVGIVVSLRSDLLSSSEALNLFGSSEPQPATPPQGPSITLPDFATLAEHISPSVVNISSTQEVKTRGPFGGGQGLPGGPGGPGRWWRWWRGRRRRRR